MSSRRDNRSIVEFLFGSLAAGVQAATADTSPRRFRNGWLRRRKRARQRWHPASTGSAPSMAISRRGSRAPTVAIRKGEAPQHPVRGEKHHRNEGSGDRDGSPIYKGRIGTADAAIVRRLRERGGVLLGKTHSTAFAYSDPAPTHNPRDLHTRLAAARADPAAAVAAGMVPVALGTQTGGSVLRPAWYCGVTGFKTTYGLLPWPVSCRSPGASTHWGSSPRPLPTCWRSGGDRTADQSGRRHSVGGTGPRSRRRACHGIRVS